MSLNQMMQVFYQVRTREVVPDDPAYVEPVVDNNESRRITMSGELKRGRNLGPLQWDGRPHSKKGGVILRGHPMKKLRMLAPGTNCNCSPIPWPKAAVERGITACKKAMDTALYEAVLQQAWTLHPRRKDDGGKEGLTGLDTTEPLDLRRKVENNTIFMVSNVASGREPQEDLVQSTDHTDLPTLNLDDPSCGPKRTNPAGRDHSVRDPVLSQPTP